MYLFAGTWLKLRFVANARVPILKLEHKLQNISCDISINNLLGQMKSKMLFWINAIDGRFRDMVLLVFRYTKFEMPVSGVIYTILICVICVGQGMGRSTWSKRIKVWVFEFILPQLASYLSFSGNISPFCMWWILISNYYWFSSKWIVIYKSGKHGFSKKKSGKYGCGS